MYEAVRRGVPFVLAGSIRDDGPLRDVVTDTVLAQKAYLEALKGAGCCLMLASALHSIAIGNLLPARVRTICVDMVESVPVKLGQPGLDAGDRPGHGRRLLPREAPGRARVNPTAAGSAQKDLPRRYLGLYCSCSFESLEEVRMGSGPPVVDAAPPGGAARAGLPGDRRAAPDKGDPESRPDARPAGDPRHPPQAGADAHPDPEAHPESEPDAHPDARRLRRRAAVLQPARVQPREPEMHGRGPEALRHGRRALTRSTQGRPELFDLNDKRCENCYCVKNMGAYVAEVQRQLAAQGMCSY